MCFALWGLVLALVIFVASGGHVFLLPLRVVLAPGGLLPHRRHRRGWG